LQKGQERDERARKEAYEEDEEDVKATDAGTYQMRMRTMLQQPRQMMWK
jgi:hypothetical protein